MNERIRALAEQCQHRYSEHNIDLEKFAQLLIADTAQRIVTELKRRQAEYDDPGSYLDTEYYVRMRAKSDALDDAIDMVELLMQER